MALRQLMNLIYLDLDRQRMVRMSEDQAKALASYLARSIRAAVKIERERLR